MTPFHQRHSFNSERKAQREIKELLGAAIVLAALLTVFGLIVWSASKR